MSAWWCGPAHVDAILSYWVVHIAKEPGAENIDAKAVMLLRENMRSLAHRYPADWWEMIPDEDHIGDHKWTRDNAFLRRKRVHADTVALCKCLDYQSCEHPEWGGSEAKRFLDEIQAAAEANASKAGQRLESHLWGWPEPER